MLVPQGTATTGSSTPFNPFDPSWVEGRTGVWSAAGNWTGSGFIPPSNHPNTELIFSNSSSAAASVSTNDIVNDFKLNSITLSNANTSVTNVLTGMSIAFITNSTPVAPSLTNNGAGAFNIDNNLAFSNTTTFAGSGSGTVTLGGVVSGPGGLIKTGNWNLVLGAANTFSGNTTINAGTVVVAHASALLNSVVSNNVNNGLGFNVAAATLGGLTGSGNITLTNSAAGGGVQLSVGNALTLNTMTNTYNGILSGAGGLTKTGAGVLTLSATNTYTGATTINSGTLRMDSLLPRPLTQLGVSASAAYSLRQLSATYSGSAIQVRRSSDNTTMDIGFIGGALDTTALLNFVGSGSGYVTTWYDQSGNSLNSSQSTQASQPRIVNAGVLDTVTLNGVTRPAVRFDGTDDFMNISLNITTGHTISYTAVRRGAGSTYAPDFGYLAGSSDYGAVHYIKSNLSGASYPMYNSSGSYDGAGSYAVDTPFVGTLNLPLSSGSWNFYKNGTSEGGGNAGNYSGFGVTGLQIARQTNPSRYANNSYGDIYVFLSNLTATQRSTLETNQMMYYGVVANPFGSASGFGFLPTNTLAYISNGATLDLNGTTQTIGALAGETNSFLTLNGGVLYTGNDNTTVTNFDGRVTDTGNIVKIGSATWYVTNAVASLSNATVTINGGTLVVYGAQNLGSGSSLTISNGSALLITNVTAWGAPSVRAITFAGGVGTNVIDVGGGSTGSFSNLNASTIWQKNGGGTLIFSNVAFSTINTTIVNGGSLVISNYTGSFLTNTAAMYINNGGQLQTTTNLVTVGGVNSVTGFVGATTGGGVWNGSGARLVVGTNGSWDVLTIAGGVVASNFSSASIGVLSGNNNNILALTNGGSLWTTGSVLVGGVSATGNKLWISGAGTGTVGQLLLTNASNTVQLDGGLLTVTGYFTNTLTTAQVVGDGTQRAVLSLLTSNAAGNVASYFAGGLTLSSNAWLKGNGIVTLAATKSLVVGNGAVLAPGASPGITTVNGTVEWGAGGHYQWEIGTNSTVGVGWDVLYVNGAITNSATSSNPFYIDITSWNPATGTNGLMAGFDLSADYINTWLIATGAFQNGAAFTNNLQLTTSAFSNSPGNANFSLSLVGNTNLFISYIVPTTLFVWTNQTDGTWQPPASWTNNASPTSVVGRVGLQFVGSTLYTATNDITGLVLNRLLLSNASTSVSQTLTGNVVGLSGPSTAPAQVQQQGSGGFNINHGLGFSNDVTFTGSGAGSLTVNGPISGPGGLIKTGSWDLVLGGNNSFTGPTRITGGSILLSNQNALASSVVSNAVHGGLAFAAGSAPTTFTLGGLTGSGNIGLTNTGGTGVQMTVNVGANLTNTYTGILSGTDGGLTKSGGGVLVLGTNSTYTGATTISAGTLKLGIDPAAPSGAAVIYNFDSSSGTTVNNLGSTGGTYNGVLVAAGGSSVLPTIITLNGPSGASTKVLNTTTVNAQGVQVGSSSASGWTPTTSGVYTMSMWFQGILGTDYRTPFKGRADTDNIMYIQNSDDTANMTAYMSGFPTLTNPFSMKPYRTGQPQGSSWHMLTFVADGSTTKIYMDGGDTSSSMNTTFGLNPLGLIGGNLQFTSGQRNFAQYIDNVYVYPTALTGAQITQLYNSGLTGFIPGYLPTNTLAYISSGATLDLNATTQTIGALAGAAGSYLTLGGGTLYTGNSNNVVTNFDGVVTDTGNIVKIGGATWYVTNSAATLSNATVTINGGTLAVSSALNIGSGSTLTISNGAALLITNANAWGAMSLRTITLASGGAGTNVIDVSSGGTGSFATLTNSPFWQKNGAGTLIFSNVAFSTINTTIVNGGSLVISNYSGSFLTNTAAMYINSGGTLVTTNAPVFTGSSVTGFVGATTVGGIWNLGGAALNIGTNSSANNNQLTVSGVTLTNLPGLYIGQSGSLGNRLILSNAGAVIVPSVVVTGANNQIQFNSGTLTVTGVITNNNGALFVVGDGVNTATLNLATSGLTNSFAQGLAITNQSWLTGFGVVSGGVTNYGTVLATNGNLVLLDRVSGTGTNRAVTGGTLTLYGANNYSSRLELDGGTLVVSNQSGLGNAPNLVFSANGGTLQFNIGGTATGIWNSVADFTTGTGNFQKTGTGTLLLTNTAAQNLYQWTGATLVNGGTLVFNGALTNAGGAVTLAGGTLGGTGWINRAVIISSGGTISPGNSPGTITVSNLVWEGGGTYLWQGSNMANSSSAFAGINWDLIRVTNNVIINATAANPGTLTLESWTAANAPGAPGAGFPTAAGTYDYLILTTAAGGISANATNGGIVVNIDKWLDPALGVFNFYIDAGNTNLFLRYTGFSNYSWKPNQNGSWDAPGGGNWIEGAVPPSTASAAIWFTNSTAAFVSTVNTASSDVSAFKIGTIVVSNSASGVLVGTNILFSLAGSGIDQRGAGAFLIGNNLIFSNNVVFGGSGAGALTVTGAVSGVGQLTKRGPWNLVLAGSNAAYSGSILLNSGTLTFSNAMDYTLGTTSLSGTGTLVKAGTGALTLNNSRLDLGAVNSGGSLEVNQGTLILSGSTTGTVYRVTVAAGAELVFTNGQNRLVSTALDFPWAISGALRFTGGTNYLYSAKPSEEALVLSAGSTISVVNATAIWAGAGRIDPLAGSTFIMVNSGIFSNASASRSGTGADLSVIVTNGGKYFTTSYWQLYTGKMTLDVAGSNSVFEASGGLSPLGILQFNASATDGGRIVISSTAGSGMTGSTVRLTSGGSWLGNYVVYGSTNTLWVSGTNAVTGARSQLNYNNSALAWSGYSNLVYVGDGGQVTNLTTFTMSGTYGSLLITNGGQLFSRSTATIGSGSSNNWVDIGGNGALWDLGNQNLTIGSGAATGNWVRVADGGTLRNGTVAFDVNGGNTTNFGNYIQLESNSTTAVNFAFGSGAGASFVTNRVESGLTSFTQSNLVRLVGLTEWNGGGANLLVGTGTGANSNLVYLGNVTLTNWGVWTVGAAASTGNTLRAGTGFTGTVASVVVTGVNNRLQFDAGMLAVTSAFTNNNGLAMQVGDGVQTGMLALTSANATSLFAGGLVVASNATLRAVGTLTTAGATGVTLTNGATLAVGSTAAGGNNVGTLTVSALNWLGGGTYEWNITNFAGTAGTGWDLLNVTGALTNRDGTTATKYVLKIDTLGNSTNAVNFNAGTDYSLQIASFGSLAGFTPNLFTINTNSFVNAPTSGVWQVIRSSSGLYLTYFTVTADFTWTNATSGLWGTPTVWQENPNIPSNTSALLKIQFTGSGTDSYTATNDWGGTAFGAAPGAYGVYTNNKILFNSSSTGTNVLMGAALAFAGANASIYQINSGMFIISNAVVLTTNMQFRGPGVGTVVLASNITGTAGSVQKLGLWELVLQGSNSFAGTVTVGDQFGASGGTLTLANAYALGTNSVTVSNGTVVGTANFTTLGNGWSNQAVLVTGSGSYWTNGAALTIGSGAATGNTFTVANSGSLYVNGALTVGTNGAGFNSLVLASTGRVFSTGAATIGAATSNNTVSLTGSGSAASPTRWDLGAANLTIGAGVSGGNAVSNSLVVDGAGVAGGAVVTNVGQVFVGAGTTGAAFNSLTLTNGGKLYRNGAGIAYIGGNGASSSRSNTVTIIGGSGAVSLWDNAANEFRIGNGSGTSIAGYNRLILDGAGVAGGAVLGNVTVLTVGQNESGDSLIVTNGGSLSTAGAATIGNQTASNPSANQNLIVVAGGSAASVWTLNGGALVVGSAGSGASTGNTLTVGTGGLVTNLSVVIGVGAARSNTVTLAGGQLWATSLIATSAGNAVLFNAGTLATASTVYSNGTDFVVGNGSSAATLVLNGGTHLYQNNLVLTNSATLLTAGGSTPTINVGGSFVIGSNATLNIAGSSAVGTLNVTGTNIWAGGGNYLWNITSLASPAGTGWDYINAGSSVISNAASSANKFIINVNSMGGGVTGFDKDLTTNLLVAAGTVANFSADAFSVNLAGFTPVWDGVWSVGTNTAGATAGVYLSYEGIRGFVWTNTTGQFSTWGQWLSNTNPPTYTTNVVLYFGGTNNQASYTASNDLTGLVTKRIVLTNQSANAQYIVGNAIALGGLTPEILQNQTGSFIFSNGFALATNTLFGGSGSGSLTMAGSLTGNGGLSLTGNYALVLSASNSYSGVTTITNGQIYVAHEYALGGSTVSNAALGKLVFTNLPAATVGGLAGTGEIGLTNTAGAALALSLGYNNQSASYAGNLSSSGSVIKVGTGTQTLTGTNTYTGDTTVNAGILNVSGQLLGSTNLIVTGGQFNWASQTAMTNRVAVTANGGSVNFSSSGTIGALTGNGGSINVNASQTLQFGFGDVSTNFTGRLLGDGTLTKVGTGTWTVTNNNSAIANYVVSAGTNVQAGGTLTATNLFISAGASYLLNGGTLSARTATNLSPALFAVGNGTNATTYQLLGGAHQIAGGMLVQSNALLTGTGTLAADVTLTNGASFAPGLTVGSLTNAGTMVLAGNTRYLFDLSNPTPGGTPGATNTWDYLHVTGNLTNAGALTIDVRPSAITNFDTDASYALTIAGAGGTFVNNGTFAVVATNFTAADGVWSAYQSGNNLVLGYEGSQYIYWTNTAPSGLWQTTNWTTNNGAFAAMPSVNTSNIVLVFTNSLPSGYTAQNDFSANLLVKRIILSNTVSTATNYLTGNAINLVGLNPRFQQEAAGMFVVSNGVNVLSSGTLSFLGAGSGQLTMAGDITSTNSGAAGLLKGGAYTLVLAGTNNISGTAAVTNGTVIVASQNALRGAVVSNTVNNGLLFSNVTSATFGALAGSQNLALTNGGSGGADVALVLSNRDATYSGVLSGNGSLTKAGSGTQILTGTNTYTGATAVSGGALTVSGRLANSTNLIVTGGQFNWNSTGAMSNVTAVSVSGGTVAFNNDGTIAGLAGSGAVTVAGGSTLAVGFGGTTNAFTGNITGSGTLTKIDGGLLTLSNGSSSVGNVIVNGGILRLAAGSLSANSLWATGGVLQVNGGALSVGLLAGSGWISNHTDFVVGDGGSAATLNVVGGTLYIENNVIVTNRGTLYGSGTLAASNGFGVVTIGSNAVIGAGASGTAVGTFTINATNVVLGGGGSYLWHWTNATGTAGSAWDLVSVQGVLSNAASVGNRFAINVGSVASNFNADTDYTLLVATSTVQLAGDLSAFRAVTTNVAGQADGLWTVTTAGSGVYLGYVAATNYTWKDANGIWSDANRWIEGAPPVGVSNLVVHFGGAAGTYTSTVDTTGYVLKRLVVTNLATSTGYLVGSNITLVGIESIQYDGAGRMVISNDLTLGRNTIFGGSGNGTNTLAGQISSLGTYGFTKTGAWTLVLSGSNTFSGGVNLLGGVTMITNDIALGAANNLVTISNATLSVTNTSGGLRGFSANSAVFDVQTNSTYTVNGSLSGAGVISLIKSNTGTLAFTGGGTVAGQTIVAAGTLRVGGGAWGNITNAAGVLIFDPSASATVNGNISGQGGITMQGGGTLFLTGNNTGLDGGLLINNGTVAVNSDNALGATGAAVVITNGGTLRATSTYTSSRTLTSQLGGAVLQVDAGVTNLWTGTITGDGGLTKSGGGVLNLTANNTYLGATIVTGGTLRVNGTLSAGGGAVTVAAGTLAGTGTIHRAVTLANGGMISAGNSAPGTLTVSNLVWNSGGAYQTFFNTWTNNGVAGVNWSLLQVTSNLVFSGGSGFAVDLAGTPTGVIGGANTNWLIATAGAISGFNPGGFSIATSNLVGSVDGVFGFQTVGNTNLFLTYQEAFVWTNAVLAGAPRWDEAGRWQGSPATSGDTTAILFRGDGVSSNQNATFTLNFTLNRLIFDISVGSNQTLKGGTLVFAGAQAPSWEQRGAGNVTIDNALVLSNTLAMSGSGLGTVTVSGVISGTNFTKNGNWTLNLSGANTFTGNVSIIGGALGWNNGTALGYTGNVVTLSNVMLVAGVNTISNALVFGGANAITNATGSGTLTLLGSFNGSGILTQQVTNLVLGGGGTYSGEIRLPASGALILSNQPTVALNLSGTISGAGSVTATNVIKTGSGTVTLAGNNTYVGQTDVRGGTLIVGANTALGTSVNPVTVGDQDNFGTAGLLFGDGVTFNREVQVVSAGVATTRVGNVSGTATLTGQLTLNDDVALFSGGRMKFTGVLTNTVSVGILTGGGGIIELAGTNKLSNGITVSGATLMVNDKTGIAAGTNLITVQSSGTLAGTGYVQNVTLANGSHVAPGDLGVGTLTLRTNTWQDGAGYAWQGKALYSNDPGVSGDFLAISNLTLSASVGTLHVDVDVSLFTGFNHVDGNTNSWKIAEAFNSGTWDTNLFAAITTWDGGTKTNGFGWWLSTLSGGTNNNGPQLWLNYGAGEFTYDTTMVIPEPNVLLLWLSSIATIYAARRRIVGVKKRA